MQLDSSLLTFCDASSTAPNVSNLKNIDINYNTSWDINNIVIYLIGIRVSALVLLMSMIIINTHF